jgi:hypothetical protein
MTASQPLRLPLHTRLCALVLAWQVFVVGLLAASPSLHDLAHHDAGGDAHHPCAVELFSHGLAPLAAAPVLAEPVFEARVERLVAKPTAVHAAPAVRLPPPCGPPRR